MEAVKTRKKKQLVLGQRLSAKGVFDVVHGQAAAEIDPAALDSASKGFTSKSELLPPPPDYASFAPDFLSDSESKAALLVTLHRLLQSGRKVRRDVPVFMVESLARAGGVHLQNSGQPLLDLARLFYESQEVGIAVEELEALQVSVGGSNLVGAAALFTHQAANLSVIADMVAALSCEGLRAKISVFDDKVYRQDSTHSSVTDAARAMKSLLLNSMMVNPRKGSLVAECVASIPEVHGAFKQSLKIVSGLLRVEINRSCSTGDALKAWPSPASCSAMPQVNYLLMDGFSGLISSLSRLVFYSSKRIEQGLKAISELCSSEPTSAAEFLKHLEVLNEDIDSKSKFRKALSLMEEATNVIALEGAVALRLLSLRDADAASKGLKGSRAPVLGKGTARSREILAGFLNEAAADGKDVLSGWFTTLQSFFSSKDDGLQKFVDDVKTLIESGEDKRLPQVPKGTRDFGPEQMMIREKAFGIITKVFKKHGAAALDTPVFELRDTLMGKYGEDSKLIYDLADQGGQLLSLRYDLTVPFARYLAEKNLTSMRRYHIAKVYRRDNPSQGRYREFYQCDFDIAGQYPSMVPDADVIKVLTELLDTLDIGDYEVKLNHRKLLDGMLAICGVPESKFRSICSAIDKLDKTPWEKVRSEMVTEKGLSEAVADRIGIHVARKGNAFDVLAELQHQAEYLDQKGSCKALEELSTLFRYLRAKRCLDRVVFDMSLARGLDYYTGVIFEAVFKGSTQVGSIAAGGRYDNLVGMFSSKQVPAVGMSLGIERVFLIMEQLEKERGRAVRSNETQVQVFFLGSNMMEKAMELANELTTASLNTEYDAFSPSKIKNKLEIPAKAMVPFVVIVGETEESQGTVTLRNMITRKEELIKREELVGKLKSGRMFKKRVYKLVFLFFYISKKGVHNKVWRGIYS